MRSQQNPGVIGRMWGYIVDDAYMEKNARQPVELLSALSKPASTATPPNAHNDVPAMRMQLTVQLAGVHIMLRLRIC